MLLSFPANLSKASVRVEHEKRAILLAITIESTSVIIPLKAKKAYEIDMKATLNIHRANPENVFCVFQYVRRIKHMVTLERRRHTKIVLISIINPN